MIPKQNRAYTLAIIALLGTIVLAGVAMVMRPELIERILAGFADFLKYFVPLVIGAKGVEKVGVSFGKRFNPNNHEEPKG